MIIIFLVYYIGNINYNDNEDNKVTLLITNKINIFNFNKIDDPEEKIDIVAFYYIDNDDEKLIFKGDNNNYYIEEQNMYNSYGFKNLVDSKCYLIIKYKDNTEEKIFINFKINYNNDNIFPKNNINEVNKEEPIANSERLIKKLENNKYEQEGNYYFKNISENVICRYYYDLKKFEIVIDSDDILESLYTYTDSRQLFYERLEDGNLAESKEINENGKINCDVKKCETIKDFAQYINYLKYE